MFTFVDDKILALNPYTAQTELLLFASENGSLMARSCESLYNFGCPAPYWKNYTNIIRNSVQYDPDKNM